MRIPFETLYNEFLRVLLKLNFDTQRAELCACLFTETSRDGVYSHGLNRFPRFVNDIQKGLVNVSAIPTLVRGNGNSEQWDGGYGVGNLNARFAMSRAIELANQHGFGYVALRHTNHWMRGGTYGWLAAEAGCMGICWTNTTPNMPVWGGLENRLGNNPLIVAVPRKNGHIVLDSSISQFSFGKVESYRRKGERLPYPGGFDETGRITDDPAVIEKTNSGLPIGYWKGSGLSLMLDLLVTILSGGRSVFQIGESEEEYGLSQIFIAFDITKVTNPDWAAARIDQIIQNLKTATPVAGDGKIYYPGEKTLTTRQENNRLGIPVEPFYWDKLRAL